MTANISRFALANLFVDNPSLVFDRQLAEQHLTSLPDLAAVTFVAERRDPSQTLSDLATACGKEAFALVKAERQSHRGWLFVADGPWRDATRIVLHQRLWKNHRNLFDADTSSVRSAEVEMRSGNNVRFAGLLEITDALIAAAIDSTRTRPSFAIIFSRRSDIVLPTSISEIFFHAFRKKNDVVPTSIDWMALAIALCPLGDLLLRVSGLFDDREAAVDLIATPQYLPTLE